MFFLFAHFVCCIAYLPVITVALSPSYLKMAIAEEASMRGNRTRHPSLRTPSIFNRFIYSVGIIRHVVCTISHSIGAITTDKWTMKYRGRVKCNNVALVIHHHYTRRWVYLMYATTNTQLVAFSNATEIDDNGCSS